MKSAIATIKDSLRAIATVLGQGQVRIPTAGKIRAGIKVLTKRAAKNYRAKDIYERGVTENRSFSSSGSLLRSQ